MKRSKTTLLVCLTVAVICASGNDARATIGRMAGFTLPNGQCALVADPSGNVNAVIYGNGSAPTKLSLGAAGSPVLSLSGAYFPSTIQMIYAVVLSSTAATLYVWQPSSQVATPTGSNRLDDPHAYPFYGPSHNASMTSVAVYWSKADGSLHYVATMSDGSVWVTVNQTNSTMTWNLLVSSSSPGYPGGGAMGAENATAFHGTDNLEHVFFSVGGIVIQSTFQLPTGRLTNLGWNYFTSQDNRVDGLAAFAVPSFISNDGTTAELYKVVDSDCNWMYCTNTYTFERATLTPAWYNTAFFGLINLSVVDSSTAPTTGVAAYYTSSRTLFGGPAVHHLLVADYWGDLVEYSQPYGSSAPWTRRIIGQY